MGSVLVIQYLTVDGVVEDPDGSDGTPFGGWALRHGPAAIAGDKFRLGSIMETGVLLFGRRTWDHFAQLWAPRDNEFALLMNAATKAVVTSRPVDLEAWSNSSVVDGDLVAWVRATVAERDVVVIGSTSVVDALTEAGLVDEYRLIVLPTAVGEGRRLFHHLTQFELVETSPQGKGTLTVYRVERDS